MSTLLLHFNGQYFDEEEIEIPSFRSMPFFERVKAKEQYVKRKVQEFKLKHVNHMIKAASDGFYFEIFLRI